MMNWLAIFMAVLLFVIWLLTESVGNKGVRFVALQLPIPWILLIFYASDFLLELTCFILCVINVLYIIMYKEVNGPKQKPKKRK